MSAKHYIDSEGRYLGAFDGLEPENGIEVQTAPPHGQARWDGSRWLEPPAFPTKQAAKVAMLGWIEELSDEITGKRPLAEKLSWPTKLMVAKEYLANQSGDVPAMISTEAALRVSTPVELAELIVAKGLAFAAAASAIAGLRAKTEAALDAVTDPYDHEVVLAAAMQEAVTLKAQLGL